MAYEQKRLNRPLTRLELAVAVILISLFVGYFLQRIITLTIAAEARNLELSINRIRASLMIYSAEKLIEGNYEEMYAVTMNNPLGTVLDYPIETGTAGDHGTVRPGRGQWSYDADNRYLVYRVSNADAFRNRTTGKPEVRMTLRLNYRDRDTDGKYTPGVDQPLGVSLQVLDDYEWDIRERSRQ